MGSTGAARRYERNEDGDGQHAEPGAEQADRMVKQILAADAISLAVFVRNRKWLSPNEPSGSFLRRHGQCGRWGFGKSRG
jgi:hypothetical protein